MRVESGEGRATACPSLSLHDVRRATYVRSVRSSLEHAAAVLRYYSQQLDRGWSHGALDRDFCTSAAELLDGLDVDDLAPADRALVRRVAHVLKAVEPTGYPLTVADLLALAGPGSIYDRSRLSPLAEPSSYSGRGRFSH